MVITEGLLPVTLKCSSHTAADLQCPVAGGITLSDSCPTEKLQPP